MFERIGMDDPCEGPGVSKNENAENI